jgi:hypothetical protein
MGLDIRVRDKEGITILDLNGRLTVGEEAAALRERIQGLQANGTRNVILNLASRPFRKQAAR